MIHGDYAGYVAEAGLDSVTQYELWKAIWSSLHESNLWELDWTLGRHRELLTHLVPMTFISNHDVTRVASQIAARGMAARGGAAVFLPGVPSIYYGDEFGLEAVKENRAGGDDAVRPEFPRTGGCSPVDTPRSSDLPADDQPPSTPALADRRGDRHLGGQRAADDHHRPGPRLR